MAGLTHADVVVVADDPTYPVGTDEWNANHLFTGGAQHQILFQGATDTISTSADLTFNDSTNVLTLAGTLAMGANAITFTDSTLLRNDANVLEIRNGTNAQGLLIDNTWTDASNYERGFVRWVSNGLRIGTEAAGTGVNTRSTIVQAGASSFTFFAAGDFNNPRNILMPNAGIIYVNTGTFPSITLSSGTASAVGAFSISTGAAQANLSGGSSTLKVGVSTIGFSPGSGSGSWASVHVLPFISGTSTGTAYGLGIASRTNVLTGGTIKLFSAGTSTTDLFTGYTELYYLGLEGQVIRSPAALSGTPATTGSLSNIATSTFTDSATAASGTAASFAAHAFQAPTLAATNASVTTTNAATVYISAAPIAGTNETITNPWALNVAAGNVNIAGNIVLGGTLVATGAITIGNTVNTVTATMPNRTVTIVIAGTTYYLHAKTTND